jgi:hypothetical protein
MGRVMVSFTSMRLGKMAKGLVGPASVRHDGVLIRLVHNTIVNVYILILELSGTTSPKHIFTVISTRFADCQTNYQLL